MPIKEGLEKIQGVVTPWGKVISLKEAYKYTGRHIASLSAYLMQVMRLIEPDYNKRVEKECEVAAGITSLEGSPEYKSNQRKEHGVPDNVPHGNYFGGLVGDRGDETQLMAGRVQEFSPERVEKEIDFCPWDIVGSELCRQAIVEYMPSFDMHGEKGAMALDLPEARGFGDLHCRMVAEDRVKYNRAEQGFMDHFGTPVGECHVTPREKCLSETAVLRNGKYVNIFGKEYSLEELYHTFCWQGWAWSFGFPMLTINELEHDPQKVEHTIRCVFEAAGKANFIEFAAIKGVRDWLGVPCDVNDGRVLGGLVRVILDTGLVPYETKEFSADRVRLDIDRYSFVDRRGGFPIPELVPAYEALFKGMAKTLVSAEWSAWFEDKEKDEDTLHLFIERKVDRYC